jgi:hypothetical protein
MALSPRAFGRLVSTHSSSSVESTTRIYLDSRRKVLHRKLFGSSLE